MADTTLLEEAFGYAPSQVPQPEMDPLLPDVVRRAAKLIANQPELWCRRHYHRPWGEQPRDWRTGRWITRGERSQVCALGAIDDVLTAEHGKPGTRYGARASFLANEASNELIGVNIVEFNDRLTSTPVSVADHLMAVADHLEFNG